jgi:hypothetical protein
MCRSGQDVPDVLVIHLPPYSSSTFLSPSLSFSLLFYLHQVLRSLRVLQILALGGVKMTTQTYKTVPGHEVTDTMLEEAAKLFSENYGIWGEHSGKAGK